MNLSQTGFLGGIDSFEQQTLDLVVQVVSSHVRPGSPSPTTNATIVGEARVVSTPTWWFETRGKDVFDAVAASFPAFAKYNNNLENFATAVISDVVVREPRLLSVDIVETFRAIEAAAMTP